MIESIKQHLAELEEELNIKVLYAVESGSRAWGFDSVDSDWDVRFIYVHNTDWYLSIESHKDNIERMLPNDIDLAGWELKKALLLFRKSNPPLLEWLRSPIVYTEKYATADTLRKESKTYFNPKSCMYHYLHMAKGNFEAYFKDEMVRVKKYFYVLRPLLACAWIEKKNEMAPMEFEKLLADEPMSDNLRAQIQLLLSKKRNGDELDKGNRISEIDGYIQNKLEYYDSYMKEFKFENQPAFQTLNSIFRTTLSEVWN